jgi:small subunit ribosomal protein S2
MPDISMKTMLEAGVHFGHQTHRWNPKMKPFIHGPRNGIYIIDLEKTVVYAREACKFVKGIVAEGGKVLFVATKKQAKQPAKEAAERAGMPFVSERWLGGMLTNFATIRQGCERLDKIDRWRTDGTYDILPKKETVMWERKRKKLDLSLGGVRHMRALPQALFVVDPETERIAVAEANRLGIPVVALVDTNCNPDPVDYVIPGNDDAFKSVNLFVNLVADACLEGANAYEQRMRQGQESKAAQAGEAKPEAGDKEAGKEGAKDAKFTGPMVVRRQLKNIPTDVDYRAEVEGEDEEAAPAPAAETPEGTEPQK